MSKIKCNKCSWTGERNLLKTVMTSNQFNRSDKTLYEEDVCPECNSEDWEEEINHFYVDVPPSHPNSEGEYETWINVNSFSSREEAIQFAKEHFGADNEGKVSLVTG